MMVNEIWLWLNCGKINYGRVEMNETWGRVRIIQNEYKVGMILNKVNCDEGGMKINGIDWDGSRSGQNGLKINVEIGKIDDVSHHADSVGTYGEPCNSVTYLWRD